MTTPALPANYPFAIYQGQTFNKVITWTAGACGCGTAGASPSPVDLTGYTALMQFRASPLGGTLYYDASSNITLGGVAGTISLSIPAATTEAFTWFQGVYDLFLTSSQGVATPLLAGTVSVTPSVSI